MIILLVFSILTLFRVNPRFRKIIGQTSKYKVHSIRRIQQIIGRVVTLAIAISKSIAKLQINTVSQRFTVTYFRTQVVVAGRSSNITADSIFIESWNTITSSIITSQVVGVSVALIVTIATNQTERHITAPVVQSTCQLHIAIGRQGITFRQRSIIRSIDTDFVQFLIVFRIKAQEVIRVSHYHIRV